MPKYKPGDKVIVEHTDAEGKTTIYNDGVIVDQPHPDVVRLTFGGFGLRFMMSATKVRHADGQQESPESNEGVREG